MLFRSFYIAIAAACLVQAVSCDRIKNKGHQAKEKAKEMAGAVIEKAFYKYDYGKPDTKDNKACYESYLGLKPSDDVNDLYAYGDFLGADYKVLMAFTCSQPTVDSIVSAQKMERVNGTDDGLPFGEKLPWWEVETICSIPPYRAGVESEHWQYLWYDSTNRKAFYESFSL